MTEDLRVVVVERHRLGVQHDYPVVGYTHCGRCQHPTALDAKMVSHIEAGVKPLCTECATEIAQQGELRHLPRVWR